MKRYDLSNLLLITIIAIVIVSIAACAKPPEEEMTAARQSVEDAADNSDVRRYASQTLEEAQRLLSDMDTASENEEYESARSLAQQATSTAERAIQEAESAKNSVRGDAESAIAAARSALEEARTALNDSRDVPGIMLNFSSARGEIDAAAEEIATAETSFQGEQFAQAETTAVNARSTISDAIRRISNAVQAASRK